MINQQVIKKIQGDLKEILNDCSVEGWDGYDAAPITEKAIKDGERLISSLDARMSLPDIAPCCDGHISLEWHQKAIKIISMHVQDDWIIYAVILSDNHKFHGKIPFNGQLPGDVERALVEHFPDQTPSGEEEV